jgi:hypothetical protein
MRETLDWLRNAGFMCSVDCSCRYPIATPTDDATRSLAVMQTEFSDDMKLKISRAFDAGNYANAYETQSIEDCDLEEYGPDERSAFVLGFFGSYSLDEIGSDREIFDESYWSSAGRYVVNVARYCDSRDDEYTAESEAF